MMQREKEGAYYKEWEKQEDMVRYCTLQQSCLFGSLKIKRHIEIDKLKQQVKI